MRRAWSAVVCPFLLVVCAEAARAQQRRVAGRVTAEGAGGQAGEPLAGASVVVAGTTFGAYTDEQGRFSVQAPAGPATLRVRRVGYRPATVVAAPSQGEVGVALARDALQLETQVVTGVATSVASVNAANSVAVVTTEQLNRVPAQTIDNALQGKVAGAVITTNSGAPGGGVQVQLRGATTINGAFQPLYVVDGVIVNNSAFANGMNAITNATPAIGNFPSREDQTVNRIADLNPNDIEGVQVLKGPAASSIYGSKGANGVVLITTKRGRAGQASVDVVQRLGTAQLLNKLGTRCFNSGAEVAAAGFTAPGLDSAAWEAAPVKCHDFEEELFGENPLNYQTALSVRGGTDRGTSYFVSGLAQRDGGIRLNDYYNKQSLRVNVGQQLGARLRLQANSELLHTRTQRGIFGNDNSGINPYTTFSQTPSFVDLRRQADGTFPVNPQDVVSNNNPFQNAAQIKTPENVFRLVGSVTANYSLLAAERQTLDATLTGGVDSYADNARVVSPATGYIEQVNANPGTVVNTQANVVQANLNGTLAHRLTGRLFTATTSGGFRLEQRQNDYTANTGRGVFPGVENVAAATQIFTTQSNLLVRDLAFFAQEEFLTLGERLLLTAGVNAERTSNNGDPTRFYAYPKFSGSYRVPVPRLDEFKVRLAWGQAGIQPAGGQFTFLTTLINEGRSGFRASTIRGFSGIKPETTTELEGGFDLTAFRGRARLSATGFRKQSDDLLLIANVAPSTGFTQQYINGGQIVNRGLEFELGLTPLQTGRVTWVSTTTFANFRGRVTQLPVEAFVPNTGSYGPRLGEPFIQQGQSPNVIRAVVGCSSPVAAGASCAAANRVLGFVGDATPDFTMGFSNDVTAGPFRLGGVVDWRRGGLGVNFTNNYFDFGIPQDPALAERRVNAHLGAGLVDGLPAYVERTGFVKIRELTLSYALPRAVLARAGRLGFEQARLELSGRNLAMWTPYTGLDPEVSNFGNQALGRFIDLTTYPPSRTFSVSVNTTF